VSSAIDAYAWMNQAACDGDDLDLFYPEPGPEYQSQVEEALAICAQCEVRDACRTDAFERRDVDGIKGGMTGQERKAILTPKAVPAQRSPKKSGAQRRKEQGIKNTPRTEAEREKENARKRNQSASLTEEQRAAKRERNREAVARYAATDRERKAERNRRYWASKGETYNARRREQYQSKPAELEAAELVEDDVTESLEEDGLSVA
jgi:hypothetical protein